MSRAETHNAPNPGELSDEILDLEPAIGFEFNDNDVRWLRSLGVSAEPDEINANEELQRLIALASTNLRTDDSLHSSVIEARRFIQDFFHLTQDDDSYRVNAVSDQEYGANFLETFRYLDQQMPGIDIKKIVESLPAVLSLAPESVVDKVNNLRMLLGEDVDIKKIVESHPAVLSYAPESVVDKVNNLRMLLGEDVDVKKIVESHPAVLGYAPMKISLLFALMRQVDGQEQWLIEQFRDEPDKQGAKLATSLSTVALNLQNSLRGDEIFKTSNRISAKQAREHFAQLAILEFEDDIFEDDIEYKTPPSRDEFIEFFGFSGAMFLYYEYYQDQDSDNLQQKRQKLRPVAQEDPEASARFFNENEPDL